MTFPNKILAPALLLLSIGVGAPAALADTLNVPSDAFPTISAAAAAASLGDTIVVAKGTNGSYHENVILATDGV
ncbi:MAG: hypothetical protein ACI9EF_003931, partial [Pseudohongiellaceae bacterium]